MECTRGYESRCQNARYAECTCACAGENHGGTEQRTSSRAVSRLRKRAITRGRFQGLQRKFMLDWEGSLYRETRQRIRMPRIPATEEPVQFSILDFEKTAETSDEATMGTTFTTVDLSEEPNWRATRGMKLLTKELIDKLPPIGGQEQAGEDAIAYAKLFTPDSNWTWYITEYEPETGLCFGLVDGFEKEMGYFSLTELKEIRGPMGLAIERDMYWDPTPLKKLL